MLLFYYLLSKLKRFDFKKKNLNVAIFWDGESSLLADKSYSLAAIGKKRGNVSGGNHSLRENSWQPRQKKSSKRPLIVFLDRDVVYFHI